MGAGIIIGGELFRGAHGFGGELGHTTVDPQGEVCACGNRGCLETRAALGALLRAAGLERTPASARWPSARRRATSGCARRSPRRGAGSASASRRPRTCSTRAGSSSAATSRPLAPWLLPGVEVELAARVLSSEWDAPGVVVSELGAEAAVRGASASALRRVFADPGVVAEL